jgi:hypothetical protein
VTLQKIFVDSTQISQSTPENKKCSSLCFQNTITSEIHVSYLIRLAYYAAISNDIKKAGLIYSVRTIKEMLGKAASKFN